MTAAIPFGQHFLDQGTKRFSHPKLDVFLLAVVTEYPHIAICGNGSGDDVISALVRSLLGPNFLELAILVSEKINFDVMQSR